MCACDVARGVGVGVGVHVTRCTRDLTWVCGCTRDLDSAQTVISYLTLPKHDQCLVCRLTLIYCYTNYSVQLARAGGISYCLAPRTVKRRLPN